VPELRHPVRPLAAGPVVLRPWRDDDRAAAHLGMQDPLVPRFTNIPAGNPPHEVRRYFHGQALAARDGVELVFATADPDSDRFLGSISLLRIGWEERFAEIGYWLAPWGRGRGVMTTAVGLLADWAFATLPFDRLDLRIDIDNAASLAVGERCGFVRTGTLHEVDAHGREGVELAILSRRR